MAKQKAADCAQWKNDPLPDSIQDRLIAIEQIPKQQRTPDQAALMDWFHRDRAAVTERQTYCG